MKAVVFDIEGTTTSIAFVYDVLFPYARRALPAYVASHWDEGEVRRAATLMGTASSAESCVTRAVELMDGDVKDTGLKVLQGLVWEGGYRSGAIRGHVFDDVAPAFERLHAAGITVAIYSSGSVAAQKLLFAYSVAGDLTPHIQMYFDTTTGPKRSAESYVTIVRALAVAPGDVLFLTDQPDEARAAREAGLDVRLMARPGNPPFMAIATDPAPFRVWSDFSSLGA